MFDKNYLKGILEAGGTTLGNNFSSRFVNRFQFWIFDATQNPFDRLRVDGRQRHSDRRPPGVEPTVGIANRRHYLGIRKSFHDVLKMILWLFRCK